MSLAKTTTVAITLAVGLVSVFEGVRTYAYRDPVGIPTICFGHTEGVKMGDRHTLPACKTLLAEDIKIYADGIKTCVKVQMPDTRAAALISFAYNVGIEAACKSNVVRFINAGRTQLGCDKLLSYRFAHGIALPGLTTRRKKERAYCLMGL